MVVQNEPIANKRINDRRRVLKAGKILLNQGGSVIDCIVRNISKTGAMLSTQNAIVIPDEFELGWDENVQHCVVVWRKIDRCGVKLTLRVSLLEPKNEMTQ